MVFDPKNMVVVLQAVQRGQDEQVRIERTLGKALLAKLYGQPVDLLSLYSSVGGQDPGAQIILGRANSAFQNLSVAGGIQVTREAALSPEVATAAAGKGSSLESNSLTRLQDHALNTLANLGVAEFSTKYRLP